MGRVHRSTARIRRPLRLLLVDDEPVVLRGVGRLLSLIAPSWEIVTVGGAREALDELEQRDIDVVMTDLHMPSMDGWQLLEALGQQFPNVGRIVHSAHAAELSTDRATRLADASLRKPARLGQLVAALRAARAASRTRVAARRLPSTGS